MRILELMNHVLIFLVLGVFFCMFVFFFGEGWFVVVFLILFLFLMPRVVSRIQILLKIEHVTTLAYNT